MSHTEDIETKGSQGQVWKKKGRKGREREGTERQIKTEDCNVSESY